MSPSAEATADSSELHIVPYTPPDAIFGTARRQAKAALEATTLLGRGSSN